MSRFDTLQQVPLSKVPAGEYVRGEEKVIIIVVSGGVVEEVNNLPDGYLYEVVDYDLLDVL